MHGSGFRLECASWSVDVQVAAVTRVNSHARRAFGTKSADRLARVRSELSRSKGAFRPLAVMLASLRQIRQARRLLRGAADLATEDERLLRVHPRWCSCLDRTPDQRSAEPVVVPRCSFLSGRAPVSREVRAPGHQRALRPPTLDLHHHQPHLQGLAKVFPDALDAKVLAERLTGRFIMDGKGTGTTRLTALRRPRTRPARPAARAMACAFSALTVWAKNRPSVTEWISVMSVERDHLDVGGDTAVPGSALRIPALELAGVDATRIATLAFVENEQRENLSTPPWLSRECWTTGSPQPSKRQPQRLDAHPCEGPPARRSRPRSVEAGGGLWIACRRWRE